MSKTGIMSIKSAFDVVLGVGILCAGAGAWLRTWGPAYLGTDVMRDTTMRGEGVVADGPYRHVRNPLYLGAWIHTLALALLMPASGAIFTIVLLVLFQMRLILAEESFLGGKQAARIQRTAHGCPGCCPRCDRGLRLWERGRGGHRRCWRRS